MDGGRAFAEDMGATWPMLYDADDEAWEAYLAEIEAHNQKLARQARAGLAHKSTDARTRFSGSLSEMSVVDLLQTIDVSRKSGVLTLIAADGQAGMISFDSGAVINATVEDLRGDAPAPDQQPGGEP